MKLIAILTILSMTLTSCNIGVKTNNKIIYVSMSKPLDIKGLVRVATDRPITVTVNGTVAEFKAGGYYLIHKSDLKALKKRGDKK